ncbi:GtrA family protein [Pseudomonas sp. P7]|uniref:GtrA family protein n=1 Tax=Pseudomonas sivasensis TaxID=1880678 RepID=UPI0015EC5E2D|nr:GtrA family protein [Pseudomonas sivasensis]
MTQDQDLVRFIRFCCVGVCNTVIHIGLVLLIVELFLLAPPIANVIAFLFANMTSYFFNANWTFQKKRSIKLYFKFFLVSLIGLAISWSAVWLSVYLQAHYLIGVIGSIFLVVIVSYTLNRYFVFKD